MMMVAPIHRMIAVAAPCKSHMLAFCSAYSLVASCIPIRATSTRAHIVSNDPPTPFGEFPMIEANSLGSPVTIICAIDARSEEHTSELQSLMRLSYAVFCLTKKPSYDTNIQYTHLKISKD